MYIGYAIIAIAVVALFVVSSPWSTILLAATLALSAIHLAGTIYMYANGKASQSDVLWSTFGLVTAGVGGLASRSIRLATAANGGEALVTASQTASKFPSFASGVRTASMPQLSGFTNPFDSGARLRVGGAEQVGHRPRRLGGEVRTAQRDHRGCLGGCRPEHGSEDRWSGRDLGRQLGRGSRRRVLQQPDQPVLLLIRPPVG